MTFQFESHFNLSHIPIRVTFKNEWHLNVNNISFKWKFNLFKFEWHSILSDIPIWVTFQFEWHSNLRVIQIWVTLKFEIHSNLSVCVCIYQSMITHGITIWTIYWIHRFKIFKLLDIFFSFDQIWFNFLYCSIHLTVYVSFDFWIYYWTQKYMGNIHDISTAWAAWFRISSVWQEWICQSNLSDIPI